MARDGSERSLSDCELCAPRSTVLEGSQVASTLHTGGWRVEGGGISGSACAHSGARSPAVLGFSQGSEGKRREENLACFHSVVGEGLCAL